MMSVVFSKKKKNLFPVDQINKYANMTTVFYRATTFLFVWMEFVKNGLGNFFIFFKGGGVLTIFFYLNNYLII